MDAMARRSKGREESECPLRGKNEEQMTGAKTRRREEKNMKKTSQEREKNEDFIDY